MSRQDFPDDGRLYIAPLQTDAVEGDLLAGDGMTLLIVIGGRPGVGAPLVVVRRSSRRWFSAYN
jgi:hypothetical protein